MLEQGSQISRNVPGYLYRAAIKQALQLLESQNYAQARDAAYYRDREARTGCSARDQAVLDRLRDAIAKLPPQQVEVVVLRYEFGYEEYEIAQFLGCSLVSVGVRLFKIHGKLRKFMGENPNTAVSAGGR